MSIRNCSMRTGLNMMRNIFDGAMTGPGLLRPIRGFAGCVAMLNGALPRPKSLCPYGAGLVFR
jgi:hypothetical protein